MRKSKKLLRCILLSSVSFIALPAKASVIQYFFANNYKNPAELGMIPQAQVTVGASAINPNMEFKGTSFGGTGTASSHNIDLLPYLYTGYRIAPQWVVGLNISHPFYADQQYSDDSIVAIETTKGKVNTTDINPQISYQVTKNLIIGAGYNFTDFSKVLIAAVLPVPGFGSVAATSDAWYQGWDVGLLYTLTPQDYLSLAYFSKMTKNQTGESHGDLYSSNNYELIGANTPATTILNYLHIFNRQWSAMAKVSYSQWSCIQNLTLYNVVGYGTINYPLHYRNTYAAQIGARYAFAPDWAVLGGAAYDEGAANMFSRSVQYPSDDAYAFALGFEHQINKSLSANLMYTYAFSNTHVSHAFNRSPTVGNIYIDANALDLSLTYKI